MHFPNIDFFIKTYITKRPQSLLKDDLEQYQKELTKNKILFFGTGSDKWKAVCTHTNALFAVVDILPDAMSKYSNMLYLQKHYTELAYSEPFYLKEFQTVIKK